MFRLEPFFFNVGPLKEEFFCTPFYSLYFKSTGTYYNILNRSGGIAFMNAIFSHDYFRVGEI